MDSISTTTTTARTKFLISFFAVLLIVSGLTSVEAQAQTSTFTYQGRFTDSGTAANGTYDMQFKLFDGAGNQIGQTITSNAVAVTSGVFTVQLDYGVAGFPGADRLLEIGVRLAGAGEPYTVLSPRQQLTSTPYAIRADSATTAETATTAIMAANANQLGGVAANEYALTSDSRLTDERTPTAGSANYIQNTNNPQATSTFNITGNGTVGGNLSGGLVNAATQYNIGGSRILSAPGTNSFVGLSAGENTTGKDNAFFGKSAGFANTTGDGNAFFGKSAGEANKTGNYNSFYGRSAGAANADASDNSFFGFLSGAANKQGDYNSFFGSESGGANTTGSANAFFGASAGLNNTEGDSNSFFGYVAGYNNLNGKDNSAFGSAAGQRLTTGSYNAFFGKLAGSANSEGYSNTFVGTAAGLKTTMGFHNVFLGTEAGLGNLTGSDNTTIGNTADVGSPNLTNATAIGANAQVDQSYALVLGSISGVNGAAADTKVGIGTTTPNERLTIKTPTGKYGFIHTDGAITVGSFVGGTGNGGYLGTKSNHPLHFFTNDSAARMTLTTSGDVGVGTTSPGAKLEVNGDVYIGNSGRGVILRSASGTTCVRLTVSNAGALVTAPVPCP